MLNFKDTCPDLPVLAANVAALNSKDQIFAASLVAQATNKPLSSTQTYWVSELAKRATAPKAAPETVKVGASFAGVIALFGKTSGKLKNPAIVLATDTGAQARLSLAKPTSKNPGFIYVRLDGEYVGKISPAGEFQPFKLAPAQRDALLGLLEALAADPAGVAAAYGKATGNCCFCSRGLTDKRSVEVGYGPICADHYELPWGE
jgi:hypothetical protein